MIDPELETKERAHYAWVLCSVEFYRGTDEGKMHARAAFVLKGCLMRLGLLTDYYTLIPAV